MKPISELDQAVKVTIGFFLVVLGGGSGINAINESVLTDVMISILMLAIGVIILYYSLKFSEFELNKKTRDTIRKQKKAELKKLETKQGWRIAQICYLVLTTLWIMLALIPEEYEEVDTKKFLLRLMFAVLLYPLFKRGVRYIYFGKSGIK